MIDLVVIIILALAALGLLAWALWLLRLRRQVLAAAPAAVGPVAVAPALPAVQAERQAPPPARPARRDADPRPEPARDELAQLLARASEQLADPQALPEPPDTLPDSAMDGVRLGELYVRAAAVRGERSRRDGKVRRQVASICVLEMFAPPALLTVVAAWPDARLSQIGAVQATRSLHSKLTGRAVEIDEMWRAASAGAEGARERLIRLLRGVTAALSEPLIEVARRRDSPPESVATQVTCLLTRIGDTSSRQHLGFGVGEGSVLVNDRRTTAWSPVPLAGDDRNGKVLPHDHAAMWFASFQTTPGDLVTVCGPATSRLIERIGESLAAEWLTPPSMLRYLVQLSLADDAHHDDRAAVSLWEGRHGTVR